MATLPLQPLRFDKGASGKSAEFDYVSATGTLKEGDLLLKTNGIAAKPASNSPAVITYLTVDAGVTMPGINSYINVIKIKETDTFEISAHHSTAASAVVPDSALDGQSDYGLLEGTVSGQSAWCLDLQDTSTKRVRLLERISTATDLYPRCRVQFLAANLTYAP